MISSFKSRGIKVSLSSTFVKRARCKDCGGIPSQLYSIRSAGPSKDPRDHFMIAAWIKKLFEDSLHLDLGFDEIINNLREEVERINLIVNYKDYSPRAFYNMKGTYDTDIVAIISECNGNSPHRHNRAHWSFTQISPSQNTLASLSKSKKYF